MATVPPEVAACEVSGRNMLERWFSYRRDCLVLLDPAQKDLLDAICAGPLLSVMDLDRAGALAAGATSSKAQAQDAASGDLCSSRPDASLLVPVT